VVLNNLAIFTMAILVSLVIGFKAYLMIQLPILLMGGAAGIWLFYIQHQFEDPYWEWIEKWDYVATALLGASYLKLPKALNWFSGSIGFHHIHHLSSRIPKYNLEGAHENNPQIRKWARTVSLHEG
jgi:omega-6 fatty acid desaturase (delta-12 desaturase)